MQSSNLIKSIYDFLFDSISEESDNLYHEPHRFSMLKFNHELKYLSCPYTKSDTSFYLLIHFLIFANFDNEINSKRTEKIIENFNLDFINFKLIKFLENQLSNKKSKSISIYITIEDINFNLDVKLYMKHYLNVQTLIKNNPNAESIIKELNQINLFQFNDIDTVEGLLDSNMNLVSSKVYTPIELVEFMIDITNLDLISDKQTISILESSIGSGNFIVGLVNKIDSLEQKENKLFIIDGYEVDYNSILVSIIRLLFLLDKIDIDELKIKFNIHHDDFLTFQFKTHKYDLILGNPPYISDKGFNKEYRRYLENNFCTIRGKADLYFAFVEKKIQFLAGRLCLVLPRYWLESDFGTNLRSLIKESSQIELLIDFQEKLLFEKTGIHSCILMVSEQTSTVKKFRYITFKQLNAHKNLTQISELLTSAKKIISGEKITKLDFFQMNSINQMSFNDKWLLMDKEELRLIKKIINIKNGKKLSEICQIKEGINTGADKVSSKHIKLFGHTLGSHINKEDGIFVLTSSELELLNLDSNETQYVKKWVKGSDVDKWKIKSNDKWIMYFEKDEILENEKLIQHLTKFKVILENRAEIKRNKRRKWYELAWPRKKEIFDSNEKLLIKYKSKNPIVAIDTNKIYCSADFRILNLNKSYNPNVICAILNSDVISFYYKKVAKKLGMIVDFYSYTLNDTPIMYPETTIEKKIKDLVGQLFDAIDENRSEDKKKIEIELNSIIYTLYQISREDIYLMKNN